MEAIRIASMNEVGYNQNLYEGTDGRDTVTELCIESGMRGRKQEG